MRRFLLAAIFVMVLPGCEPAGTSLVFAPPGPAVEKTPKELPSVAPEPRRVNTSALVGLEAGQDWFVEQWSNPIELDSGSDPELGHYLKLNLKGGEKDKSAIGLMVAGSYGEREKGFRVDFYNPNLQPVKAAVGIFTAEGRRYFESLTVTVPNGWSSHAFDLNARQWKSEKSGWQFKDAPGSGAVVQVDILVYVHRPLMLHVTYVAPPVEIKKVVKAEAEERPESAAADPQPGRSRRRPRRGAVLTPREERSLGAKLSPEDKTEILRVLRELEE